ncbi:hypothetical protein KUCAC02_022797, partial [Chaenocephalus aceratus]
GFRGFRGFRCTSVSGALTQHACCHSGALSCSRCGLIYCDLANHGDKNVKEHNHSEGGNSVVTFPPWPGFTL